MNRPAPATRLPKLTPDLSRFVEGMGMYFQSQGVPRIGGRILGLLMIAHRPLSAEDIASILKISRGSISTNVRALVISGMVEKVSLHADRTTYFVFSDAAMEHRLRTGVRSAQAFRRLVEQGLGCIPARDPARHHLVDALDWSDVLIGSMQRAIDQWRLRHKQQARPRHTL